MEGRSLTAVPPSLLRHSAISIRRRGCRSSICTPAACEFFTALLSLKSIVVFFECSILPQQHLGFPVCNDFFSTLLCSYCNIGLDELGDHFFICSSRFRVIHCHETVRTVFSSHLFRPAGLSTTLEVSVLVPGTDLRSADVLVHPAALPSSSVPSLFTAKDIFVRSPYAAHTRCRAAFSVGSAARHVKRNRMHSVDRTMRASPGIPDSAGTPPFGFKFRPPSFDRLGALTPKWSTL